MNRIEKLFLNQKYKFDFNIEINDDFFQAELQLTPSEIKVEIYGEIKARQNSIFFKRKIDSLSGGDFFTKFVLHGLNLIHYSSKSLPKRNRGSFFKAVFAVDYVLYADSQLSIADSYHNFKIDSPSFNHWLGHTAKQMECLDRGQSDAEFIVLSDGFHLVGGYSYHTGYSALKGYEELHPRLCGYFHSEVCFTDLTDTLNDTIGIFSFLYGSDLEILSITSSDKISEKNISIYFQTEKLKCHHEFKAILFPFSEQFLSEVGDDSPPNLDVVSDFFSLDKGEREYYKKYLKYMKMNNPEDTFLGLFRLLERCSYIKENYVDSVVLDGFIKRSLLLLEEEAFKCNAKSIKKLMGRISGERGLNSQKLSTEACISKKMKLIPNLNNENWKYTPSNLNEICKLRNDISHANDFSTVGILEKSKFVEAVLVFLLLQLVGISAETSFSTVKRLDGYYLLKNSVE
ncbi:MAG: hypothetical protein H6R05_311 [Burkholderiaceae bacterium]|nr:hypothetical protein [Burkholderiaceae bacterium]